MSSNLSKSIERLEKRSSTLRNRLLKQKTAKKFFTRSSLIAHTLRQRSSHLLAGAGLVGALLTMPAPMDLSVPLPIASTSSQAPVENKLTIRQKLMVGLQELLPHNPERLSPDTAKKVEQVIYDNTGIQAKAVLDGQSLNHQLGYIGFEQHLTRFPGDSLAQHDDLQEAGMAPGRGAFGYFAPNSKSFTTKQYLQEKYYCVAQTLYLSNWNKDFKFLKDWYAFRKMIVINPTNGLGVVCDLADAGPANWTGKQFGGSPETMQYLDLNKGPRKGLVLILFVDDPDNKIPLGPLNQ